MSTATTTLADKIASAIVTGKLDDELDALSEVVKGRLAVVRARQGVPARMRFSAHMRPAYMSGCEGTVTERRGTRFAFYPKPGSRAAERSKGGAWRIRLESFDDATQARIKEAGL